jgi:hypothetical protein
MRLVLIVGSASAGDDPESSPKNTPTTGAHVLLEKHHP